MAESDCLRQFFDGLGSPSVEVLMIQDIIAYLPVMEQQLGIGGSDQPNLRLFYF